MTTTKPDLHLIDLPNSDRTAVFESNSLSISFYDSEGEAQALIQTIGNLPVPKPQQQLKQRSNTNKICFESTNACNMACKYCFQESDPEYRKNKAHMTVETAVQCLQRYMPADRVKVARIGFMGGEPTLNMDLICRLMDYAGKTYDRAMFDFTTNGLLLAEPLKDHVSFDLKPELADLSIVEFLAMRQVGITLSFDGQEEVHDEFRVMPGNRGSHAKIISNLKFAREHVPNYAKRIALRATLNPNIAKSKYTLLDRLKYFNGLINEGLAGSIHIEPVALPDGTPAEAMAKIEVQYLDASEWFISQVKAGQTPHWNDVVKRVLSRLYFKTPAMVSCGAGQGYLVCGVDGSLYSCHRTAGADIGDLATGVDTEKLSKWEDNRMYAQDPCPACAVRYLCGGTCRASNLMQNGSVRQPADFNCSIRKVLATCAMRMMDALSHEDIERILPQRRMTKNRKQARRMQRGSTGKALPLQNASEISESTE